MPAKPKLSVEQLEIAAQFSDLSFDHPRLNFSQVAAKAGVTFPSTPAGRAFKRQAKEVFDGEREK